MSVLMFSEDDDSVIIVTDTLATTVEGEPMMFQTKAWHLPHFNMAIASTGVANLGALWNDRLRTSAVAQHIGMIDTFAPETLREIWDEVTEGHDGDAGTATVYHFGFEPGSDKIIRHVYRSASNFESERYDGTGFGVKPPPETFDLEAPMSVDEYVELAKRLREENDSGAVDQPVAIGGELYLMIVRDGFSQTVRIHKFDDYDDQWAAMIERLARTESS